MFICARRWDGILLFFTFARWERYIFSLTEKKTGKLKKQLKPSFQTEGTLLTLEGLPRMFFGEYFLTISKSFLMSTPHPEHYERLLRRTWKAKAWKPSSKGWIKATASC